VNIYHPLPLRSKLTPLAGPWQAAPYDCRVVLALRTRLGVSLGSAVSWASRRAGTGEGSVVGGRATLLVDPEALKRLSAGRAIVLVSGTNGKTTTTRLLAAAVSSSGSQLTSNLAGSNLPAGLVGALSTATAQAVAVLEVDEGFLASTIEAASPRVVVLLNLSRDQLDRIGEVRLHAAAWAEALSQASATITVANADDPLIVWAADKAASVVWVATGQQWTADATSCPRCGGTIAWTAVTTTTEHTKADLGAGPEHIGAWSCSSCDLRRPLPDVVLDAKRVVFTDGRVVSLDLALPGWCNQANAAMAVAGAWALDGDLEGESIATALGKVTSVAGRYETRVVGPHQVRLLLAKNPAGWDQALDMIRPAPVALVVGINARVADGRDPSWLWDVNFERLRGRQVIATGDRGRDLAVRLRYADVDHSYAADYRAAVAALAEPAGSADTHSGRSVDLVANYTAFQDARSQLR